MTYVPPGATTTDSLLWTMDGYSTPGLTPNPVPSSTAPQAPQQIVRNSILSFFQQGPSGSQMAIGAPVGYTTTPTLITDQGVVISNTRSTCAMCMNAAGVPVLVGPNYPRVEPNGLLVEGSATNLVAYSQCIQNGAGGWTTANVGVSNPVITNNTTDVLAPDGTQTASKMVLPACTGAQASIIYQGVGTAVTRSVWMRTLSGTATVQLSSSVVGAGSATTCNVTSAWQRFVLTYAPSGTYISIGYDGSETGGTFSGPAATIYVWGAQAETTAWATSYMPTNTNFQANSNPTSAYWAASNCTITDNYALAPDGTMTAQLITTIAHGVLSTGITNTSPGACGPCATGQNYCMSFYAKAMPNLGNGSIVGINPTQGYGGMTFDIVNQRVFNSTLTPIATQNGTIVNTGVQVLANGWARYWFTFTAPGNGNPTYQFAVWEQTMGAFYNTTGGYNCLIWGTQFEPGNYPSQYMSWGPTITTTRGQDNISIAAPGAAVINPSLPFTITLGATPQAAWNLEPSGAYLLDWSNVGSARRKSSIYTGGSGASGNLQGVCSGDVSGDSVNLGAGSGYSNANPHIIKYAYAGVGKPMTFLVDGLVYGTQPNGPQRGTGPEAANIYLGNYSAGSAPWNGWISSLLITTP